MKLFRKMVSGILVIAMTLVGSGAVAAVTATPAAASEIVWNGTIPYRTPVMTVKQKAQVAAGTEVLNRGMRNHQKTISFVLDGYTRWTRRQQTAVSLKLYQDAFRRHRKELMNGQYMVGTVIPKMNLSYAGNRLTFHMKYNCTRAQELQAWAKAKLLVKTLNISSSQTIGMKQIYNYICRNYKYDYVTAARKKSNQVKGFLAQTPTVNATVYGAMRTHRCDCTGFAQTFYLLCRAKGWSNVYVAVNKQRTHAYNAVVKNGRIRYVDSCFGSSNAMYRPLYYMVSQVRLDQLDAKYNLLNFQHPLSEF